MSVYRTIGPLVKDMGMTEVRGKGGWDALAHKDCKSLD